ncbi:MAG: lysophospholipid acyltransferase family protein [Sedimentisphaeraceae bacterium JB056]
MSGKRKKKSKKNNPVSDYITYLGVRMICSVLFMLGIDRSMRLACGLGRLMWYHYHRGRGRALENLKNSFPDKDEQWIEETGKKSFQHLVMLVVDIIFTTRLVRKDNWKEFASYVNTERCKWMMAEGKGMILLTPHYGNFEIIGYLLGLFGFDIYSIARPIDNPYINKWLYSVREKHGQRIIDKKGASAVMPSLLKKGAVLGFIADQDAGRKGVFVDFFGRKASTYKSIGLLAITENLPIGIGVCRQEYGKFFFEIECGKIITPDQWQDKDNPLKWVTQEFTSEMERLIRKDPSQYWWLHRRWKHRPKEERNKAKKMNLSYDK